MKTSTKILAIMLAAFGLTVLARAVEPTVQSASATSVQLAENTTLSASVADADGDLSFVAFYAVGPGVSGWLHLGDRNVTGTSAAASLTWQPPQAGIYTVLIEVHDTTGLATAQTTFEIFGSLLTVPKVTIGSGANRIYQNIGEIATTENQTESKTVVQSGGNLILWAGGRVILKPGFHAQDGSFFWAAVDHNMNGYSDMEEQEQNFISGVPDAWLVDHGVNLSTPISSWQYTPGQYLAAYQGGYAPGEGSNPVPLVIFTPNS